VDEPGRRLSPSDTTPWPEYLAEASIADAIPKVFFWEILPVIGCVQVDHASDVDWQAVWSCMPLRRPVDKVIHVVAYD
jgi:hypothetical protein